MLDAIETLAVSDLVNARSMDESVFKPHVTRVKIMLKGPSDCAGDC